MLIHFELSGEDMTSESMNQGMDYGSICILLLDFSLKACLCIVGRRELKLVLELANLIAKIWHGKNSGPKNLSEPKKVKICHSNLWYYTFELRM
jgi:hypothetical protein